MAKKEHHVVYDNNETIWKVKKNNSKKSSTTAKTKDEAIKKAREISKNQKSELVIHKKDGKINKKDSHGKDTCPPKDKN